MILLRNLILLLILTTFSYPVYSLSYLGGNFKGPPKALVKNASPGTLTLIEKAYKDINPNYLRDYHVHVFGTDKTEGTTINRRLFSWLQPYDRIKTSLYMSGATIENPKNTNAEYMKRLLRLIRNTPLRGKFHILAFDHFYNEDGTINYKKSEFYTSNEYVMQLAKKHRDMFEPIISVHPYREDALEELEKWAKQGVRWVKWLPNAQGMDASKPRNDRYYAMLKRYDMKLLTHVSEEQAIRAKEHQKLGNPLLFRRPLDQGVTVVMAHCASLGKNEDLDNPGTMANNFDLFIRLMDTPKYKDNLFGEISAMTQINRLPDGLLTLLKRQDLHPRLINGSDYPLPGINIIIQTKALVKYGMITQQERQYLNEIYSYNPLLFDFVLKRTLKHPETKQRLQPIIFANPAFFK